MSESTTEFFRPRADSRPAVARPTRQDHVTAVIASHNGGKWLPGLIRSLRESQRCPDRIIGVDTASQDDSADLLAEIADRVVELGPARFGAAVNAGVAEAQEMQSVIDLREPEIDLRDSAPKESAQEAPTEWIWLLHDDCAVDADTLNELLADAHTHEADVVGAKLRGLGRRQMLRECGKMTSATGHIISGVEPHELDQGQFDHRGPVAVVSSAGMLVRAELWRRLGGMSAGMGVEGTEAEFCYRAHRAGATVRIVPAAVVFHRGAGRAGVRRSDEAHGPREEMRTAARLSLVMAPLWRLPFVVLRLLLSATVGAALAGMNILPGTATDRFLANIGPVLRPPLRTRRRVAKVASVNRGSWRRVRSLQVSTGSGWEDSFSTRLDPAHLRTLQRARVRMRRARNLLLSVVLPLALVCLAVSSSFWFSAGVLSGGALQPSPDGFGEVLARFMSPWHEVGMGSEVAAPAYLFWLTLVSVPFFGNSEFAVQVLLLLSPVLASLTAFVSLRGLCTGLTRAGASVAYGLLPATVAAVGTGRLGIAVAVAVLPPLLRGGARLVGVAATLPPATWGTVVGLTIGMALLTAFSPVLGAALLLLALLTTAVRGRGRALLQVLAVAGFVIALLWPWSLHMLSNPSLLLFDTGLIDPILTTPATSPWQLLLLDPGGLGAPLVGLGGVVVACALLATFLLPSARGTVFAWFAVLVALTIATVQSVLVFDVPWSAEAQRPYPGAMMVLAGGLLIMITVLQIRRAPRRGALTTVLPGMLVASTVAMSGWWILEQPLLLEKSSAAVVSPYVAAEAGGDESPRTIVITSGAEGPDYRYLLVSGDGPRLGDAETAPPYENMLWLDAAVSRLVSGNGGGDLEAIGAAGVHYVQADIRREKRLTRQLDAVTGLRRISTVGDQGLWEVESRQARARFVADTPADDPSSDAAIPVPVAVDDAGVVGVDTDFAAPGPGQVILAEQPSSLWRATLDDGQTAGELVTASDEDLQTFEIPQAQAGQLVIGVDASARQWQLLVPAAALLLLALTWIGWVRKR